MTGPVPAGGAADPGREPELDCRGRRCPLPVIMVAARVPELAPGTVLRVRTDDPAAGPDLAAWCRMRGHGFLGGGTDGDHEVYRIQVRARIQAGPVPGSG